MSRQGERSREQPFVMIDTGSHKCALLRTLSGTHLRLMLKGLCKAIHSPEVRDTEVCLQTKLTRTEGPWAPQPPSKTQISVPVMSLTPWRELVSSILLMEKFLLPVHMGRWALQGTWWWWTMKEWAWNHRQSGSLRFTRKSGSGLSLTHKFWKQPTPYISVFISPCDDCKHLVNFNEKIGP